jgi:hypothetical protein
MIRASLSGSTMHSHFPSTITTEVGSSHRGPQARSKRRGDLLPFRLRERTLLNVDPKDVFGVECLPLLGDARGYLHTGHARP